MRFMGEHVYLNSMKSKSSIFLCLACLSGFLSASSRYLEPNKLMIDTVITVVDTIPAIELFQMIKPSILNDIEELRNKHTTLQAMLQSTKKKAKTEIEKAILCDAFDYILNNTQYYKHDIIGTRSQKDLSEVRKGKLTETIRALLSHYDENYLAKEIAALSDSLENNWTSFIDNPPTKRITIQVENPNYRGYHYDDYYDLNRIERDRLLGDYTFILSDNGVNIREEYPIKLSYIQFPELPNYRVIDNDCMEIYDNNGDLVYVPILKRQSNSSLLPNSISKEIMRLVYQKDYQNNKYNIQAASLKTQNFLSLWIGRKHGLSKSDIELNELESEGLFRGIGGLVGINATAANEARCREIIAQQERYKDDAGERFLKQLESDHSDDFGYIYAIERLSDKKFAIVYLSKTTLQPSICAVVLFSTGDKPYTSTFTVKLSQMPNNVPPVVRQ